MKNRFRKMMAMGLLATNGLAVLPCHADDNTLFSDIRATSVFGNAAQANPSELSNSKADRRVVDINEIARLLREVGMETTVIDGKLASTKKQLDPWEFPVLVTVSEDERDLFVTLGLSTIADVSKVPAEKLISLLETNQKYPTAQFAFHRERKQTEVLGTLKNQSVTGQMLRDEINRLAALARDTENAWYLPSETTTKKTADESPLTTMTVASMTGRWSAVKSATEAFAAEFKGDGTFVLAYVLQGKQIRSTGKFLIDGTSLTLNGETGPKVTGSLKVVSDKEFQFSPTASTGASTPLSFKRVQ